MQLRARMLAASKYVSGMQLGGEAAMFTMPVARGQS